MTVGRAKAVISYIWLIFGGTIFGLVVYLTLIGKFRFSPTNWDAGLSWVIPLILPVLAFMVATWTVQTTQKDRMVLRHSHVFFAAVFFSVLYFLGLFGVLWRLPREIGEIENYVDDVMHTSSWYFGAAQALIIVVLGKFFLEEIGEEAKASPPGRS